MFHFHPFLFFILPDAKPKCWVVPAGLQALKMEERVGSQQQKHPQFNDAEAHT